jgi:hypothetical protein
LEATILDAYMDASPGLWYASVPDAGTVSGAVAWTAAFQGTPPAITTWSFLLDGSGEVMLSGAPAGLIGTCTEIISTPSAVIDEAVIIIDAEFAVPVQASTWGGVKALYRY